MTKPTYELTTCGKCLGDGEVCRSDGEMEACEKCDGVGQLILQTFSEEVTTIAYTNYYYKVGEKIE